MKLDRGKYKEVVARFALKAQHPIGEWKNLNQQCY
jgi:hypothetical protein